MPEEPSIAQRLFETVAQGLNRLVTAADVPKAIQQFLTTLGEAAQVDRVYVFEQHPDPQTRRALVSQRFEWTAPGIASQFDNPDLQNFPVEDALPRWFRTISRGDVVRGWVRDLPPEERAILEPQGILSILVVPILEGTICWGFVGFDDCTHGRDWADTEALLLKAAAGALGSALLRARAELALRESEQRLRLVLEGSGQGFWDWDIPTGRVVFDDTWATMLGYQIGEIMPHVNAWEVLVHPEDMIAVRNALVDHIEGRTPAYECEHRLRCKNGNWKWVLDRGKVVQRDAAGGAVRACGTHTDISERRRMAQTLEIERDLGIALSVSLETSEMFQHVLEASLRIGGFDAGGCYQADAQSGTLHLVCHRGLAPEFVAQTSLIPAASPEATLVQHGQPIYASAREIISRPRLLAAGGQDFEMMAVVPICHEGRVLGCLNLASLTRNVIASTTRHALETVASRVGGALAKAITESALIESRQNLQAMFDHLDDFLFIADLQGRILHTNPVVSTRLEYTTDELLALDLLQLHPPDRRAEAATVVAAMLEGRKQYCTIPLRSRDGTLIPVETKFTRGQWSHRPALFGLSRDITERLRVAAALRETEANNRAILHAIPDLLFRLDRNGRFVDVLANRQDHFAHPVDQVLGRTIADLAPPEFATAFLDHVARTLDTHAVQVWEYEWPLPGGTETFEARFVALNPDEVLVLSRNITERKRAASEVLRTLARERELSALKSTFVSVVSHEFRTPLGAILGATEMLEDFYDRLSTEKRKNYFHIIRQEVRRLTAMVGDMLLQGQLDAGRLRCQPTTIDLPKLVRRVVAEIEAAFPKHPPVQVQIAETASQVRADDALLGHMLRNLLSNACKYSPQLTLVALTASRTGDNLEIAVEDHGVGIPAADLDTIFSPFRRGGNVAHIKGTGVGLYILRKCAELHGGQVSVRSQIGRGSVFHLILPANPQPTPTPPSAYAHAPDR